MASIPGFRFDITGASGSQGLLAPKESWRCYILPRGAYASQDSTGTTITFDSAAVASRFAANNWVQVALSVDSIRQVTAVGGNSITVNTAVTVTENDRVFLIGNTQPSTSGGSATYTVPDTTIYKRDDDAGDTYTNSMITTDANGLVQGYAATNFYDAIIQDADRTNQAGLYNLPVGVVEGVSVSGAALFGDTVTINGIFGVTGWAFFGSTVTMHAALGVTGWATFGSSVTLGAALGVTGHATFGSSVTLDAALGVTGHAQFASTVAVDGALGVTGAATFDDNVGVTGSVTATGQPQCRMTSNAIGIRVGDNSFTDLWFNDEDFDVGGMITAVGSSFSQIEIQEDGLYLLTGSISWLANSAGSRELAIFINGSATRASSVIGVSGQPYQVRQSVSTLMDAVTGNTFTLRGKQTSGDTRSAGIGDFSAVKVC